MLLYLLLLLLLLLSIEGLLQTQQIARSGQASSKEVVTVLVMAESKRLGLGPARDVKAHWLGQNQLAYRIALVTPEAMLTSHQTTLTEQSQKRSFSLITADGMVTYSARGQHSPPHVSSIVCPKAQSLLLCYSDHPVGSICTACAPFEPTSSMQYVFTTAWSTCHGA